MAMSNDAPSIGTVVAIRRYPVKSMQAEPLDAAELHWTWLHGDRQYAFVKQANTSGFPWLTARTVPELVRYRVSTTEPGAPDRSEPVVTAPDSTQYGIRDPRLADRLAGLAGTPVWLLRLGRGAFDAMPIALNVTGTAQALAAAHGSPVALDRFRPNIVVEADDPAATEQDWIGHTLAFGNGAAAARIGVDWMIPRCAMVAIDPDTAARDPAVVRTVVERFGNRVGVYCSVRAPGTIRVGDRLRRVQ